ncbi:putative wall-associated receptor kinase-like 16 [Phragmites australis]|uniref:putative wall-associated receptor kinase-like 16 n=1 Tax=Phragmites australis TaxID=29695 RepID=UPI002D795A73|nr:putative wall-associated receptor kinase-like 16 [Phragmites australis]
MLVPVAVVVVGFVVQLATSAAIGLPNCTTTCGNVSVPYPFGLSPGCYLPGFNLTCDHSQEPPRLLVGDGDLRVTQISLLNSTVTVIGTGINMTMDAGSSVGRGVWGGLRDGGPLVVSGDRNELIVTGCNVLAELVIRGGKAGNDTITGCASFCPRDEKGRLILSLDANSTRCSGIGCCQMPVNWGRTSYDVFLRQFDQYSSAWQPLVFIADLGWFATVQREDLLFQTASDGSTKAENMTVPVVLDWVIESSSADAPGSICSACKSGYCKISEPGPFNATRANRVGPYVCRCSNGYEGNPYLADGCTDIDECGLQDTNCYGECTNLPGTFSCLCPRGTRGDPHIRGGCSKSSKGLSIGLGISSGASLISIVLGASFLSRKLKKRRVKKQRQKNFKKNRGQLWEQLVSQRADIPERMIITLEELEKATNNFDKSRELGGGGHGIVYKGILSDQNVVAIKKSKIVIQQEIDEFINEVATLSQINHKNIVKLFGCCLETEVPLLVYEFISNGTLYEHLHVEGPISLSWENRLRIATGTARAVAYLHSATFVPIIHRDIKPSNILLDDSLTSKVSDFGASRYVPTNETGVNTVVQGTIGYLDPMYFCTGRLTEKSDVYSIGVILVELLTRKKPTAYKSNEGDNLLVHFVALLEEGNLVEILDTQVVEEGDQEIINSVANLAARCIQFKGEDRPTMRQVEMKLEGLIQASREIVPQNNTVGKGSEENYTAVIDILMETRGWEGTSVYH